MKRITAVFALLLGVMTAAFAATAPSWYNDVTSITANGQYYIFSANNKGFMQGGNTEIVNPTVNNFNTTTGILFTITNGSEGYTYNGSSYLSSSQDAGMLFSGTAGPIGTQSTNGAVIIWTSMESGKYWNIHGKYSYLGDKYAALSYDGSYAASANVNNGKPTSRNIDVYYTEGEIPSGNSQITEYITEDSTRYSSKIYLLSSDDYNNYFTTNESAGKRFAGFCHVPNLRRFGILSKSNLPGLLGEILYPRTTG